MQLLRVKSMIRYLPPNGTAGLARCAVKGCSRSPRPPARIIVSTFFIVSHQERCRPRPLIWSETHEGGQSQSCPISNVDRRSLSAFEEPVHEWPPAALSVRPACSRATHHPPPARPRVGGGVASPRSGVRPSGAGGEATGALGMLRVGGLAAAALAIPAR